MNQNRFFPNADAAGVLGRHDRTAWLKGGENRCAAPPHTPPENAWRIVLLGAPGVGKSTQAELLSERLGACHLLPSDVFHAARNRPESELTPAMHNALDCWQRGEPVPDETVLNLVGERLHCLNCSGGFLLEGFPRTVAQAKALEQLLETNGLVLTAVFHYELPVEKIVARIAGRRICPHCQAVYHITSRPSLAAGFCDQCSNKLIQRVDDQPAAARARAEAYEEFARPLVDFYRQRGLLLTIPAEGTPEDVYHRTRNSFPGR